MNLRHLTRAVMCSMVATMLFTGLARASTVYSVAISYDQYGHLNQDGVDTGDGAGGANSCVPTAVTNSFTFLQNRYSSVYGTSLIPIDPDSTAEDMAKNYMHTSSVTGTSGTNWIDGKYDYMEHVAAGKTSYGAQVARGFYGGNKAFVDNGTTPTWQFLFDALEGRRDIELGIIGVGIGHAITLSSFNWTDENDDGVIQQGESATLDFIDPAAPGALSYMDIWQSAAGGTLNIDSGDYSGYRIVLAISETARVAEPGSMLLAVASLLGLALLRRRESSSAVARPRFSAPPGSR